LRRVEDFKIDRVIQVMAVIGDFVGQVGYLSLERRKTVLA